jgi:transposase
MPVMKAKVRFLGLDVHAETIAVAVAEPDGEVRSLGTIANRAESVRKLVKKLGPAEHLRACYEAGPTGYVLYWQLTELGVECAVIAPTLVPVKAGDRVKTDRRDALKLARCYRSGDLTSVWVPDEGSEALRDLVRAREAAKQDQLRARHRLSKFLLRTGQRPAQGIKAWTQAYMVWVQQIRYAQMAQEATRLDCLHEVEHMGERVARLEQAIAEAVKLASPQIQEVVKGLQALRGIAQISAVTIAAELGNISRFEGARQLMGYSGAVPSEDSSGKRKQRGSITKTGNSHLRRIAVEAAWSYRLRPGVGPALRKRQQGVPEEIKEIAWKAQHRLYKRYSRLSAAGKDRRKIITAVGRELLGFIWAIGIKAEAAAKQRLAA